MSFKLNSYYKGINPDDTYIVYKVINVLNDGTVDIQIIIGNDTRTSRHISKGAIINIDIDGVDPDTTTRWILNPKEIKNESEILALLL